MRDISETSRGKSISYGEAQKPVNVFFKVYVDWAKLPNPALFFRRKTLRPAPATNGIDTARSPPRMSRADKPEADLRPGMRQEVGLATGQASMSAVMGRRRTRLPVAAYSALATAGAITGVPGSPTPVGFSCDSTMYTSMAGDSSMRSGA